MPGAFKCMTAVLEMIGCQREMIINVIIRSTKIFLITKMGLKQYGNFQLWPINRTI